MRKLVFLVVILGYVFGCSSGYRQVFSDEVKILSVKINTTTTTNLYLTDFGYKELKLGMKIDKCKQIIYSQFKTDTMYGTNHEDYPSKNYYYKKWKVLNFATKYFYFSLYFGYEKQLIIIIIRKWTKNEDSSIKYCKKLIKKLEKKYGQFYTGTRPIGRPRIELFYYTIYKKHRLEVSISYNIDIYDYKRFYVDIRYIHKEFIKKEKEREKRKELFRKKKEKEKKELESF